MLVDAHLHLYEAPSPEKIVSEARKGGVTILITAGEDEETSRRCLELSSLEGVYAAVGVHPSRADTHFSLSLENAVAVGEIGLDEKYSIPLRIQEQTFRRMLELAKEYEKPVVVHSGRSYKRVMEILSHYDVNVLMHWYSGDVETALEGVNRGYLFSFGPAALKYSSYRALIDVIPVENILTETDYPVRIGGRENHPLRVKEVLSLISSIKGDDEDRIARIIYKTALSFFQL